MRLGRRTALAYGIDSAVTSTPREALRSDPRKEKKEESRFFRVVSAENAAKGQFHDGILVMADSAEDARARHGSEESHFRILPSDVLVEQMTEEERRSLHVEGQLQRRWRVREDEEFEKHDEASRAFVEELSKT